MKEGCSVDASICTTLIRCRLACLCLSRTYRLCFVHLSLNVSYICRYVLYYIYIVVYHVEFCIDKVF